MSKCYRCKTELPIWGHHLIPRNYGGSDTPSNILRNICAPCHDWAEEKTEALFAAGYHPTAQEIKYFIRRGFPTLGEVGAILGVSHTTIAKRIRKNTCSEDVSCKPPTSPLVQPKSQPRRAYSFSMKDAEDTLENYTVPRDCQCGGRPSYTLVPKLKRVWELCFSCGRSQLLIHQGRLS